MGEVMTRHMRDLEARHPIVGATRSLGLFGMIELVKDRTTMEPLAPFNGTSEPMSQLGRLPAQEGLYTFVRWNTIMTNPPLIITEEELRARVRHHRSRGSRAIEQSPRALGFRLQASGSSAPTAPGTEFDALH